MPDSNTLWECKPRTKAKLEILNQYLGAWFGILANKGFPHVYYIDGFCGPGEYSGGEVGSPIIATKLANATAAKFPNFRATLILVDENENALYNLKRQPAIKNPHSHVKIDIRTGAFSKQIDSIVELIRRQDSSPTFSFIDPFGFGHSPLKAIEKLMHNSRSEIFINFWCGYMNRFKAHQDLKVKEKIRGMVGENNLDKVESIDDICEIFEANLKSIGQYTLKFMMRDEMNVRDNAFFFCGRHPLGFEKIKSAMWKVDPKNGNSFSAHEHGKEQAQASLFPVGPQTQILSKMILERFSGQEAVPVKEIFRWTIEETDTFLKLHARSELERLYEQGKILKVEDPNPKTRKRSKGQWPDRLLLSFADK